MFPNSCGFPWAPYVAGPGYYPPYLGAYPYGFTDYTDLYDYNNNLVLEDNEILDLVSDTIAADPYIPQSDVNNIQLNVKDGVVRLSGTVKNKRSKPLAYADAFWSRGVIDVESDINVEERGQPRQQKAAPKEKQSR
ncbi:MAG: BON domain-containing protein [Patescibacteria group bacterium]|nr:BON domain-containing protein [Patescibacteria group bacterium]